MFLKLESLHFYGLNHKLRRMLFPFIQVIDSGQLDDEVFPRRCGFEAEAVVIAGGKGYAVEREAEWSV